MLSVSKQSGTHTKSAVSWTSKRYGYSYGTVRYGYGTIGQTTNNKINQRTSEQTNTLRSSRRAHNARENIRRGIWNVRSRHETNNINYPRASIIREKNNQEPRTNAKHHRRGCIWVGSYKANRIYIIRQLFSLEWKPEFLDDVNCKHFSLLPCICKV